MTCAREVQTLKDELDREERFVLPHGALRRRLLALIAYAVREGDAEIRAKAGPVLEWFLAPALRLDARAERRGQLRIDVGPRMFPPLPDLWRPPMRPVPPASATST